MPFDSSLCDGCIIQGEYRPVTPEGYEDAPYIIVTDVPSKIGAKEGRMLPPSQKALFKKHMEKEGFDLADFQYHPMCLCPYDQDNYPNKEKKKIHQHCRRHFEDFIEEVKPAAIVPFGAGPTSQVFGRSTKITTVRGLAHKSIEFGIPIFPMLSPGLAVRYVQNEPIFAADAASFGRLVDAGMDVEKADDFTTGEYKEVTDLQFLIDQDPELIAFDTETTGLRWYQRGVDVRSYKPELHEGKPYFKPRFQILTMQFTIKPGEAYVLVWDHPERPIPEADKPRLRNQIRRLLCDEKRIVVGQGLKFDCVGLWMTEGIRFRIGGDTGMLAAIQDENLPEKNLDVLTKMYAPEMAGYADRFNATVRKDRMWETPINRLIPYGGGDTDASYRVYEALEELVAEDAKNWNHYCTVSLPGLNAFASMETRGMMVDTEVALPEFQAYMTEEVERQRKSILAQIPRTIRRKHVEDPRFKGDAVKALSLGRQELLKDVLFYHEDGFKLKPVAFTKTTAKLPDHLREPSTSSKDHLPFFFDKCPFTFELAEYVKDERLLSTNIVGFIEKFVVNGKVRPSYFLDKAVTRRSSSKDPNGQNFPKRGKKAKMYQKVFVAPPGWVVISCDLSQAELRIAGDMANDPEIIRIYSADGDIHIATACIVLGINDDEFHDLSPEAQKDARTKAKAVNFGFIYGMSWRKFITYAKTQYGVEFTEKQAKRIRNEYFKKYKGLARWHQIVKDFVQQHGMIRSYSGLVRHLPQVWSEEEFIQAEAVRQGINSPVQEFGSTIGVIALGNMEEEVNPEYLQMIGFIHDALYAYVREEHVDWGLKTMKRYMEGAPLQEMFGRTMRIPIKADASFGWNHGDLFELADFRLDQPYDFTKIVDKDGAQLVHLPRQRTPANDGRLDRPPYTSPDDLEDENVVRVVRLRKLRSSAVVNTDKERQRRIAEKKHQPVEQTVRRVRRSRAS